MIIIIIIITTNKYASDVVHAVWHSQESFPRAAGIVAWVHLKMHYVQLVPKSRDPFCRTGSPPCFEGCTHADGIYTYVCVYIYIYIYTYVYICIHTYIYIYICMQTT